MHYAFPLSSRQRQRRPSAAAAGLAAAALLLAAVSGCHRGDDAAPGSVSPVPGGSGGPVSPGGANPPPGEPNHMTPEQQAQIERYKSMAPGTSGSGAAAQSTK